MEFVFIVKIYLLNLLDYVGIILGQHQFLGFAASFSANYPCIACRVSNKDSKNLYEDDESLLRNERNYAAGLQLNDVSQMGIKKRVSFEYIGWLSCY